MTAAPRLPPPVRPGDRVGVAALSGPLERDRLVRGLEELRRLGYEPVTADNLTATSGLFAGSDRERLAAFHRLAADASLRAILFARGGHGVLRVLPAVDWTLLARHPRAYVGYSDLTAFLDQVIRRLGIVCFHGPMVAKELARGLDPREESSLVGSLAGEFPVELEVDGMAGGGVAEGSLRGGCLSLLTATLGTPFAPDLAGSILFWEEVDEPLYRIDRMLTHLRLSGRLAAVRGVVVGHVSFADVEPRDGALDELLAEFGREIGSPVTKSCASGHGRPNLTLPLGMIARLDADSGTLRLG